MSSAISSDLVRLQLRPVVPLAGVDVLIQLVDPDKYRSQEDKEKWRKADPIVFFEHELEKAGLADEEYFKNVRVEVDNEVQEIIKYADESPDPKPADLYRYVYADEWEDRPELKAGPE